MSKQSKLAHSADVQLTLKLAGRQLDVAQVASDFLILRDKASAGGEQEGTLVVSIDGKVTETPVILPNGLDAKSGRISYW